MNYSSEGCRTDFSVVLFITLHVHGGPNFTLFR